MLSLKAFGPPFGLLIFLFFVSSIPGVPIDGSSNFLMTFKPEIQNALHVPLFGFLQILWMRGFALFGKCGVKFMLLSLAITIGCGLLDELHQTFIPGRYGGLTDITLDVIGAVLGAVVFLRFRPVLALR